MQFLFLGDYVTMEKTRREKPPLKASKTTINLAFRLIILALECILVFILRTWELLGQLESLVSFIIYLGGWNEEGEGSSRFQQSICRVRSKHLSGDFALPFLLVLNMEEHFCP